MPAVAAAAIPIVRKGHGRWPASAADLRAVMDRLPPGALTGLAGIAEVDFGGAHSVTSGIEMPHVLGEYEPSGARIRLYSFRGDEQPLLEVYLRLHMLETLVHEIAHHVDYRDRFSRQRARADRTDEIERTAEQLAEIWLHDAVIPYLEEAYPGEVAELRSWLIEHGGADIPLEVLLGPSPLQRRTVIASDDAFYMLLFDVRNGRDPTQTKVDFAFFLHYGYEFELALEILERVLASEPDHADALKWRAHVLEHLAR